MKTVMLAGVAVLDFVFSLPEFPTTPDKYRADNASIVNGGNAANAAIAVSRLGGNARLAARLGDDIVADMIVAGVEKNGVNCDLVRRFEEHRSSFSSILVDNHGERQIVNFRDGTLSMEPQWLAQSMPEKFDVALGETRWPAGAKVLMQAAKERGVPGIMDGEVPIFEGEDAIRAASHVAFSARAVKEFTGEENLEQAALAADVKLDGKVYATSGADGVIAIENGEVVHHPAFPVQAVDTLGAGDVWHAAFALQIAEGADDANAIRFANAAAAIKCTRQGGGSGAPDRKEVHEFLDQNV